MIKIICGDIVDVRNDFLYNMEEVYKLPIWWGGFGDRIRSVGTRGVQKKIARNQPKQPNTTQAHNPLNPNPNLPNLLSR